MPFTNHKFLTIAAVFLIVGVLAVSGASWAGLYGKKTQSPAPSVVSDEQPIDTSDWVTYRNENIGIEFKLPKTWIVDEQENKSLHMYDPTSKYHSLSGGEIIPYEIGIQRRHNTTIENEITRINKEANQDESFPQDIIGNLRHSNINGKSVVTTPLISNAMGLYTWQFMIIDANPDIITILGSNADIRFKEILFPTILQTIRVLK